MGMAGSKSAVVTQPEIGGTGSCASIGLGRTSLQIIIGARDYQTLPLPCRQRIDWERSPTT